jgi:hypothetical protein
MDEFVRAVGRMGKLLNLSTRVGIRVDLHPRSAIMATDSAATSDNRGWRRFRAGK